MLNGTTVLDRELALPARSLGIFGVDLSWSEKNGS